MGFLDKMMITYNTDRDEQKLLEIRPIFFVERAGEKGDIETFQNETLRPILKFQHNLLLDFLISQPNIESVLNQKEIRTSFERKLKFFVNQSSVKNTLIGMIVAFFTQQELKFYSKQSKEINRRISHMLVERFSNSL